MHVTNVLRVGQRHRSTPSQADWATTRTIHTSPVLCTRGTPITNNLSPRTMEQEPAAAPDSTCASNSTCVCTRRHREVAHPDSRYRSTCCPHTTRLTRANTTPATTHTPHKTRTTAPQHMLWQVWVCGGSFRGATPPAVAFALTTTTVWHNSAQHTAVLKHCVAAGS